MEDSVVINKYTRYRLKHRVSMICLYCKLVFDYPKDDKNRKYCSRKCQHQSLIGRKQSPEISTKISIGVKKSLIFKEGIKKRIVKPNSGQFKKGYKPQFRTAKLYICKECNVEYTRWNNNGGKIYCSRKCMFNSKEYRQKRIDKMIGHIPWNKGKIFLKLRGENHPNWKGGTDKLERIRFRDQLQKKIFERDNYTCQFCGQIGGYLQVDHIQPWADYIELRFSIDNCRTLCMSCHYEVTFGRSKPSTIKTWGHNLKYFKKGDIL